MKAKLNKTKVFLKLQTKTQNYSQNTQGNIKTNVQILSIATLHLTVTNYSLANYILVNYGRVIRNQFLFVSSFLKDSMQNTFFKQCCRCFF